MSFAKFLRTAIFIEHLRWLLLLESEIEIDFHALHIFVSREASL